MMISLKALGGKNLAVLTEVLANISLRTSSVTHYQNLWYGFHWAQRMVTTFATILHWYNLSSTQIPKSLPNKGGILLLKGDLESPFKSKIPPFLETDLGGLCTYWRGYISVGLLQMLDGELHTKDFGNMLPRSLVRRHYDYLRPQQRYQIFFLPKPSVKSSWLKPYIIPKSEKFKSSSNLLLFFGKPIIS